MDGLVYICVPEAAIVDVTKQLTYHDGVCVVHASGSLGLDVFPNPDTNCLPSPHSKFPWTEIQFPESIPATLACGHSPLKTHRSKSSRLPTNLVSQSILSWETDWLITLQSGKVEITQQLHSHWRKKYCTGRLQ